MSRRAVPGAGLHAPGLVGPQREVECGPAELEVTGSPEAGA